MPSTVRLATPAPELVRANVVFAPSTRLSVVAPAAVRCSVASFAANMSVLLALSRVNAPPPPELSVSAPAEVTSPPFTCKSPPVAVQPVSLVSIHTPPIT